MKATKHIFTLFIATSTICLADEPNTSTLHEENPKKYTEKAEKASLTIKSESLPEKTLEAIYKTKMAEGLSAAAETKNSIKASLHEIIGDKKEVFNKTITSIIHDIEKDIEIKKALSQEPLNGWSDIQKKYQEGANISEINSIISEKAKNPSTKVLNRVKEIIEEHLKDKPEETLNRDIPSNLTPNGKPIEQ